MLPRGPRRVRPCSCQSLGGGPARCSHHGWGPGDLFNASPCTSSADGIFALTPFSQLVMTRRRFEQAGHHATATYLPPDQGFRQYVDTLTHPESSVPPMPRRCQLSPSPMPPIRCQLSPSPMPPIRWPVPAPRHPPARPELAPQIARRRLSRGNQFEASHPVYLIRSLIYRWSGSDPAGIETLSQ